MVKFNNARERERLEEVIERTMTFLLSNARSFTPHQHLRRLKIENMLLRLEGLIEKEKRKKAIELSYDIDDELFLLLYEPITDAQ